MIILIGSFKHYGKTITVDRELRELVEPINAPLKGETLLTS